MISALYTTTRGQGRVQALLCVGLLWLGTVMPGWAGVEGTHHDMRSYSLDVEQSVCAYCHVPHGAQSADVQSAPTIATVFFPARFALR